MAISVPYQENNCYLVYVTTQGYFRPRIVKTAIRREMSRNGCKMGTDRAPNNNSRMSIQAYRTREGFQSLLWRFETGVSMLDASIIGLSRGMRIRNNPTRLKITCASTSTN